MMNIDVYSMVATQQAELDRAIQRNARLSQIGVVAGPSLTSRVAGIIRRMATRERAVQPIHTPGGQIYCLTTRAHEPV